MSDWVKTPDGDPNCSGGRQGVGAAPITVGSMGIGEPRRRTSRSRVSLLAGRLTPPARKPPCSTPDQTAAVGSILCAEPCDLNFSCSFSSHRKVAVLSLVVGLRSALSVRVRARPRRRTSACRWRSPPAAQVRRDQRAKLDRPAAGRLAADFDSALDQEFLDITNAEREPETQPYCLLDHFGRKPMTLERYRLHQNLHLSA